MRGQPSYGDNQYPKKLTLEEAKQKIARYCAYQERAHAEVEEKLFSYGLGRSEVEDLLAWLITENYVNEQRFAIAFAGGKFRIKHWGKLKIKQYLEQKKVSAYSINKALDLLDEEAYTLTIDQLIEASFGKIKSANVFEFRHKVARSLINKGFEPDLVWDRLKLLVKDDSMV